ncbi:MAG: NUDIX domain-containing protein [Candidatus Levybacteria bacterium]|nr:NUDIX domain-containing protein [Candidatus Levybacteria bacterium]
MEITKHFTATTIIVHKKKVLLHLHKKLGIWIPVGGHIDRDELPQTTALREIKEESGLDVTLYNPDKQIEMGDVVQLFRPMHILLENINQFHQHIDFIYYATANSDKLSPQNGETTNLKWFTADEVKKLDGAPVNVKALSLEAIELLETAN